jgi:hypothetical protein
MIKKALTSIAIISAGFLLNAMEPHIKTVEKKLDRDGRKYIKTDRKIFFNNGNIWYLTVNEEGKKELVQKKWGDYFMGLEFGRPKRSNGGWSLWGFFECYARINGKYQNIPKMFLPENVYITQLNGATLAEIICPLSADGKAGKMSMRVMQFPSHKNWLFMRVKFTDTNINPWRFTLSAYPGNSNNPKERERWIATKENKYCVSKNQYKFAPESNALVMYSKFIHENFGNFLIFEAAKFDKLQLPKCGAGVMTYFFPKKGIKEFKFALGYFSDKSAADELPRFLGESQDNIYKFMENIDWEPKLNTSEFTKLYTDTDKLIKDMAELGSGGKKFKKELDDIKTAFDAAVKSNNMNKAAEQQELLKKLKAKVAKAAMSQFN